MIHQSRHGVRDAHAWVILQLHQLDNGQTLASGQQVIYDPHSAFAVHPHCSTRVREPVDCANLGNHMWSIARRALLRECQCGDKALLRLARLIEMDVSRLSVPLPSRAAAKIIFMVVAALCAALIGAHVMRLDTAAWALGGTGLGLEALVKLKLQRSIAVHEAALAELQQQERAVEPVQVQPDTQLPVNDRNAA